MNGGHRQCRDDQQPSDGRDDAAPSATPPRWRTTPADTSIVVHLGGRKVTLIHDALNS